MPMAMTTLKGCAVIEIGDTYQLVLGYNLMNTPLHIEGDDLGLNGGLSEYTEKSDIYEWTGQYWIYIRNYQKKRSCSLVILSSMTR